MEPPSPLFSVRTVWRWDPCNRCELNLFPEPITNNRDSSSSISTSSIMVEFKLMQTLVFVFPAPKEGRSYCFDANSGPELHTQLELDPSSSSSSLDAIIPNDSVRTVIRADDRRELDAEISSYIRWAAERGEKKVVVTVDYRRWNPEYGEEEMMKQMKEAMLEGRGGKGTCAVCLRQKTDKGFRPSLRLDCLHLFHLKCAAHWLAIRNSCPLCRAEQKTINC